MRTFYPEHAILSYMYLLERMPNVYMAIQNKDEKAQSDAQHELQPAVEALIAKFGVTEAMVMQGMKHYNDLAKETPANEISSFKKAAFVWI